MVNLTNSLGNWEKLRILCTAEASSLNSIITISINILALSHTYLNYIQKLLILAIAVKVYKINLTFVDK
jgi:hypothetical protein